MRVGEVRRGLDRFQHRELRDHRVGQRCVELAPRHRSRSGRRRPSAPRPARSGCCAGSRPTCTSGPRARCLKYCSSTAIARLLMSSDSLYMADAVVDVRRHVHDVARARHQRGQPLARAAARDRASSTPRPRGCRGGSRPGASGLRCEHRLQRREHLGGAALGLRAAGLPVVPGLRVHHGLGVEREDRVVVRILRGHGLHRVGVGRVERGALGLRVRRVALLRAPRSTHDPSPARRAPARLPWQARRAPARLASGIIGALMFGPSTSASPHQAIAQLRVVPSARPGRRAAPRRG